MADMAVLALVNTVVLGGIPFLAYFAWHKLRYKRGFLEITARAGLRLGAGRYIAYGLAGAIVVAAVFVLSSPALAPYMRPGSPQRPFVGLGFGSTSVAMALLYGLVATGFMEEFVFRGLIAGALSRRMSIVRANLAQAFIFLLPHFLVLRVMPEMWAVLP